MDMSYAMAQKSRVADIIFGSLFTLTQKVTTITFSFHLYSTSSYSSSSTSTFGQTLKNQQASFFTRTRQFQQNKAPSLTYHSLSSRMAALATAEICDTNATHITSGDLRVLHPVFQVYGQARAFSGPIVTIKVFEDNVLVRAMLETKGEGRVLVIDGGGSMRCALVGGNLGQLAQSNGWAGIVVNGCIRDVDEINACDIGVRALSSHPLKSSKKGTGEKHVPIYVGGAFIRDGEWLYADSDGIIVSKFELSI